MSGETIIEFQHRDGSKSVLVGGKFVREEGDGFVCEECGETLDECECDEPHHFGCAPLLDADFDEGDAL